MLVRIRERRIEAQDVVSLVLECGDGAELPPWQAGAHIDLKISDDVVRQYSLCSLPAQRDCWRLGVLRQPEGRGGSEAVFALAEGALVEVSAPRNNFALVEAQRYLFVAGGIGITPVLPMIHAADTAGADWRLVYGGRSRKAMAFTQELARYGDRVELLPEDERGLIDLAAALAWCDDNTLVYACGPEAMLNAIETATIDNTAALHLERFTPKAQGEGLADEPFEVEFVASGVSRVVPAGRSILSVAEEEGLPVFSSCEQGTCGTCVTAILSGRVDHRDSLLSATEREANEQLCICVSRAEPGSGPLRLDL